MLEGLTEEIIHYVEKDLRKYPDWILRIEASGLGITNRTFKDYNTYDFKSLVESSVEYDEQIKKKIIAIESVYDRRLNEEKRKLIDLRYFQDEPRWKVMQSLKIKNKNEYYKIRDFAIRSFARVLGYLKDD
ncbi:MAG: hypothetical protein HFJ52_04125 [Clostridia bacterium]|jgi:hypothetical protein|nr:hypothetical protein [Clostridia bacterium]